MNRTAIALAALSLAATGTVSAQSTDAPPSTPGNFRATLYDKAGGELFWRRSTDDRGAVRGYEITRNGRSLGVFDALSYYDRSLRPNTPYTFTVVAIDSAGQRSSVATTTLGGAATTPPVPNGGPAAPRTLRAEVYSKRSAELFWRRESAALALRYEIRRDGQVVGTTNGVSYYTRDLAAGTDYAFEVVAIDRQGRRSSPSPIGLRTDGDAPSTPPVAGGPGAPVDLRVDVYSARSAELFWRREPAALALRYEIRRDGRVVGTTDGVSYYTRDLAAGIDYTFEVIAIGRDGRRSGPSRIPVRTGGETEPVTGVIGEPRNLRADVYSSTAAELFWDRSSTIGLTYEIRRDDRLVGTTNGTSFYDDGLANGATYRYEVVTIDSGRRSFPSTVTVRTGGPVRVGSLEVREFLGDTEGLVLASEAASSFEFPAFGRFGSIDELPLPAERPYFVQRETSTPFSREPFVEGRSESVLIDLDESGTGTYSVVRTRQDEDTFQRRSQTGTRTYDGTSVTWSGVFESSDSSSAVGRRFEFSTDTRSGGDGTRRQSGTATNEPINTSDNTPIEVTYDVTMGVPADDAEGCPVLFGTFAYDSEFRDETRPFDTKFFDTTTITKREGDRYWNVRETNEDGSLRDEYLIESIPVPGLFCDFPEL